MISKTPTETGLTDYEELVGVKAASLSGIDSSLIMPWQDTGADPLKQDLFVEVDYMTATGHDHNPTLTTNWSTFQSDMTQIFQNDSGWTGRTVVPHIMVSQSFTEVSRVGYSACSGAGYLNFYDRKGTSSNFDPLRAGIFHYVIIGHQLRDTNCTDQTSSGQAEIWGNDVIISLGGATSNVGTTAQQKGTLIHELGHNLSLVHNGNQSSSGANSCIHSSPLNYRYQFPGDGLTGLTGLRAWSYSRGQCDASGLGGCTNTCVLNDSKRCVPTTQTTSKGGCATNNGACDCDAGEWATVNLDIPASAQMSFTACQIANCGGASDGAPVQRHLQRYFLGDDDGAPGLVRGLARARKGLLLQKGMVQGTDFVVHPKTERLYSID